MICLRKQTYQLDNNLQPYYVNFEGKDLMRSTDCRALAAEIVLDYSRMVTVDLTVCCICQVLNTAAAQPDYSALEVAVLGAKAQLLGNAGIDDAALRQMVSQEVFNIRDRAHRQRDVCHSGNKQDNGQNRKIRRKRSELGTRPGLQGLRKRDWRLENHSRLQVQIVRANRLVEIFVFG